MSELSHRQEREDLAAALRMAARNGWQSGICNHFSLAVDANNFLINPEGLFWSEVRASDLLLVDKDGKVVEGDGVVEPTAFFIHYNIHRLVGTARCVLHAHPRYVSAIVCSEGGRLEMSHQDALRFYGRVSYDDDFGGAAITDNEGKRIASALGNRSIMLMAHHGVTVVGPNVARAYDDFYYLEKAAEYQVTAMSMGRPLRVLSEDDCKRLAPTFATPDNLAEGHFQAARRLLDRQEPDYRH
ncbi:MAG: class II aldolase/adducin family protein [Hyphomicrobiaceae bacterium]